MKKLLVAVGLVVVLLIAGLVALPFLVPTETVIARVQERVRAQTGRELTVGGPVEISVLPDLAVRLENVALANAPGGEAETLASLGALEVSVSVLPLLSGNVAIDRFRMVAPVINLEVAEDGTPNWRLGGTAPDAGARAGRGRGRPGRRRGRRHSIGAQPGRGGNRRRPDHLCRRGGRRDDRGRECGGAAAAAVARQSGGVGGRLPLRRRGGRGHGADRGAARPDRRRRQRRRAGGRLGAGDAGLRRAGLPRRGAAARRSPARRPWRCHRCRPCLPGCRSPCRRPRWRRYRSTAASMPRRHGWR